jgi:Flp pilus assembly pilin Flp
MKREKGQSISEYFVIGGLVTIVVVPALILLGSGIDGKLKESSNKIPGGLQSNTGSLVDANGQFYPGGQLPQTTPSTPISNVSIPGGADTSILKGNGWQAKYDPATGQIIYTMPNSSAGGTTTNNVSGFKAPSAQLTQVMAIELQALVNAKDANGEPLPQAVQLLIEEMANYARKLAVQEESLAPFSNSPQLEPSAMDSIGLLDGYAGVVNGNYAAIMSMLSAPEYADISRQLSAYTGMISQLAANNLTQWSNYSANSAMVVGTPPAEVPAIASSTSSTSPTSP